jgi:hypothetical protein
MIAGGGLDTRVSRHIAIRPIEADYLLTRLQQSSYSRPILRLPIATRFVDRRWISVTLHQVAQTSALVPIIEQ